MDKKTEALKLALECVEAWDRGCDRDTYWRDIESAVTAIKEALAEQPAQQQEPKLPEFYAWFEDGLVSVYQRREDATPLLLLRENLPDKQPAQQEPQQPVQEPVAWMVMNGVCTYQLLGSKKQADALAAEMQKRHDLSGSHASFHVQPLYTTPPASKPLTHPQIHELDWPDGMSFDDILRFIRAIEAAHGIKGEA